MPAVSCSNSGRFEHAGKELHRELEIAIRLHVEVHELRLEPSRAWHGVGERCAIDLGQLSRQARSSVGCQAVGSMRASMDESFTLIVETSGRASNAR